MKNLLWRSLRIALWGALVVLPVTPALAGERMAGAVHWGGRGYAPEGPPGAGFPGARDGRRSYWRNLSPAQRDAIRRLSREEREALARRGGPGAGTGPGPGPGARLSPEERRQLREQIRQEHERGRPGYAPGEGP